MVGENIRKKLGRRIASFCPGIALGLTFIFVANFGLPVLAKEKAPDYGAVANWAYTGSTVKGEKPKADVFFICPTVYFGKAGAENMSLQDTETKANFLGATNMEKGIYETNTRFFAPYYRQVGLYVYEMKDRKEQEKYFRTAYKDVSRSFKYYLKHYNEKRPIILAGFSQGADMCIRLMKDNFKDKELQKQLVATYAIGWRLTPEEVKAYPQLKPAKGERDIGVIVAFNTEAESIQGSMLVPKNVKTYAINPLNWKTNSTYASKELNKGACFTGYDGKIKKEAAQLTGAYLDSVRGTLKVTDVDAKTYPPILSIFEPGIYHLYDYQFFYRNLEDNVQTRLTAYQAKK